MNTRTSYSASVLLQVVVPFAFLIACAPKQSQHTVEYYKSNESERKARLAECANDPGALKDDPLCVNARAADFDDAFGSMRDLPPVGLNDRQREEPSNPEKKPTRE